MQQRTDEWFMARLGKVTASNVYKLFPNKKGEYYAHRKNYMMELVCQILTGTVEEDTYKGEIVEHGKTKEDDAKFAFEHETGLEISECGFIDHPTIKDFGASPDGLISTKAGYEAKCPQTSTHVDRLFNGKNAVELKYFYQIHAGMMCTNRKEWYFHSYDDRLPHDLSSYITKYEWDDLVAESIEIEVNKFNNEKLEMVAKLQELRKIKALEA